MIDFNTRPVQIKELLDEDVQLASAVRDVYGFYVHAQPLSTYLNQLQAAGLDKAVLHPPDCSIQHGRFIGTNEQIAKLANRSDRIVGFASVDPRSGDCTEVLRSAVVDLGLRGLFLDPALQGFDVTSDRALRLFSAATELQIPVMVQAGVHWSPKAPGLNPISLERVLMQVPGLRLVVPQFGWPWVDEALMLAVKYPRVTLDTSILYAGSPEASLRKVIADRVGLAAVEGALTNQIVFASGYPLVDPKRVRRAFDELELSPQTRSKILTLNACRLLEGESK